MWSLHNLVHSKTRSTVAIHLGFLVQWKDEKRKKKKPFANVIRIRFARKNTRRRLFHAVRCRWLLYAIRRRRTFLRFWRFRLFSIAIRVLWKRQFKWRQIGGVDVVGVWRHRRCFLCRRSSSRCRILRFDQLALRLEVAAGRRTGMIVVLYENSYI